VEHLQHFGLPQDPFSNEPDLRFFFESASHRDAQRRVERGLRQHKGLTLLTGEGGMGKTLLARRILDSLEEEVFEATLLVMLAGAADATGILQRFVRQLGTEDPSADRATLLAQIYEQLAIIREDGRHAVLMIDDAQVMTPGVFAELGGLLNLEYEDRRMISMLLIGSPELDALVQRDASMAPRIDVRVQLHPLSSENAAAYVAQRLAFVGASTDLVPPTALDSLYKFGRGRPRLINTLADNALFEAYLDGRSRLEPGDVERAAMDLGVGPDPGTTYTQTVGGSSARPAELDPAPERAPFSQRPDPAPAASAPAEPDPGAQTGAAVRIGADVTLEEPFDLDPIEASPAAVAGRAEAADWSLDDLDLAEGVEALDPAAFEGGSGSGSRADPSREKPGAQDIPVEPEELDGLFVELIEE